MAVVADAGPSIDAFVMPVWIGVITDPETARVEQVVPGAPADQAGVKVGDQVVSIAGHEVSNGKQVVAEAHALKPEQKAPVVVKRGGSTVKMTVTAKPRPSADQVQATFVGKAAPAVALRALDGTSIAIDGHVTVLDFWATWCKPCLYTTPHLDDLAKAHPDLRVIGISDDDIDLLRTHLAAHPVSFAQARDDDSAASRAYLIQGLPTIIVIDRTGIVRWATVGVPDLDQLDATIVRLLK
ncbi:MAG: redoxin domain-containing protein [Kofleriaceae bacterium]